MTVSTNFFDVLGAAPVLGRTFQDGENLPGRPRVVILSDGFWRRRFGSDPTVVDRTLWLDGVATQVVGIMPPAFHVPGAPADLWVPVVISPQQFQQMRRPHWLRVVARLAPGVSRSAAEEEMRRIAADLEREYPETNKQMGVGLGPLHEWFVGDTRNALLALMGAVALVLLVACINVASLLLARATARRQEVAIRMALGAGRIRLVRQVLTEGLVLAAFGALGGIVLALAALSVLKRVGPTLPRLDQIAIDGTVLTVVAATTCLTTLLFGIVPAWQSAGGGANDDVRLGSRGPGGTPALRRVLIVAEVALSVVLLVGAGLLLRSFERLTRVDPGVDQAHALTFRINVPSHRYDTDAKVANFFSDVVERLRAIPGVRAAGASVRLALEGRSWTGDLYVEGRPDVWGRELRHKAVTPGYFEAAGIRLVRGRDFAAVDLTGAPVAIVNQAFARAYLEGVDPLAQRLAFGRSADGTKWRNIIGVVADEKQDGLGAQVKPEVYDPHSDDAPNRMSIVVRTASDPMNFVAAVRREVAALDPTIAIYELRTLEEVVHRSLAAERFTLLALSAFASAALVLATVGLYGIVAFTVGQRRREIGVRLALGARRADVLRMVVWDGLRLVIPGLAIGTFLAVLVSRSLSAFLFEIGPADPLVLAGVATLLGLAGALASYIPARRASLIDPALSLRAE
jgi:predicted permease